jgi:hypothetical protein
MPKYVVKDMHLVFGREGDKSARTYAPGEVIDLSEAEARKVGSNIIPIKAEPEKKDEKK